MLGPLGEGALQKLGATVGNTCNKESSILGSILGLPAVWKLRYDGCLEQRDSSGIKGM